MKKAIAIIIASVFLFTGCASVIKEDTKQNKNDSDLARVYQQVDLTPGIEKTPALYFLNADQTTLVAETRSITIKQNTRPERRVVEELLNGPQDENLLPVAAGFELDSIETMYNVVNVNLTTEQEKSDDQILILCLALTNTLCEFLNVNYVNVYINGRAVGYQGEPVGALTKNQGVIADEIAKQLQHAATTTVIPTVLYFLDDSEKYLVPEVRSLQYEDGNYIARIIEELAKGPEEMYYYRQSVDSSIRMAGDPILQTDEDGKTVMVVDLNKSPVVFTQGFEDGEKLAIASIVYTLLGFYPDVDEIKFTVNGVEINENTYTKDQFEGFVGAAVRLYFPNADSTKLMAVDRTISQEIASFPSTVMSELINGPAETDSSDLWPAFPEGVDLKDINDIYIANDIVVVDFNASIIDKLSDLSSEDEILMIYSIIHSLTYLPDIRLVQFLVDKERVQYISNTIDVRDPMMKNPGIVKY